MHPNFTQPSTSITVGGRPSAHAVAASLVERFFKADEPRRIDEAIEDMGYHEFHDAVRRGFLRTEIVHGGYNLAHRVADTPTDRPKRLGPGHVLV